MSRGVRILVLLAAALFLIAAVLAAAPGDSPSKVPSILIISILGVLSALIQVAQTEPFRRILRRSGQRSGKTTIESVLNHFGDRHIVLRSEATGHQPIYQLDIDYWTNLELDFGKLAKETDSLDLCAGYLRSTLPNMRSVRFIDPLDVGQSDPELLRALDGIRERISGEPFVRVSESLKPGSFILLAGTYSPAVRNILLQEGNRVILAIFLIGPDSQYLARRYKDADFRCISLVSADTLRRVDPAMRRAVVWHP